DPELDLVHAGTDDVARDAEQLRPGRALRPDRLERRGAALIPYDLEHVDERLDVVDRGRLSEQPDLDGKGRLVARLPALALDRLEEGRLLAADVGAGPATQLDVEVAEEARVAAGGDRALDPGFRERVLAADVEVRLPCPHRERLDRHRLDDGERVALH